ncbi:GTP 3',8-cyclase MoaA [Belliella kenyensis]|uniref:GTP 3',8-cyclase n=1 Tax=Belliella kenyensis TaxID=1472724 RepID=A0ABV8EGT8_9BACT|nr:GTP 3',8-cyclase MoaA [Belliella kenyensis]MCH7401065.1 GTP 3',8-cyclase MoaA [Belliella kenyensis]MDN3604063.1 GTP 3',8-cyclase MoaA [Belliella kenyensis]
MTMEQKGTLEDRYGRVHNYLRISLTDNCNFRCSYCMPEEDISSMPNAKLMQVEEINILAKKFVSLGINKIRLTGGEPLVRKEFPLILAQLAELPVELTLTSNGVFIDKFIESFKTAGLKKVNISLDTLNADTFYKLTKRDQFSQVWNNIQLLLKHQFRVKINVVALNGIIEKEILDFIAITKELPIHVRFIEFMPFAGNYWNKDKVFTAAKMLQMIREEYEIMKLQDDPNDTAKAYQVKGHMGTFAFITTMSEHFCGTCNRLRLTADGKMKNCLFGKDEMDLLGALRAGDNIDPLIKIAVGKKHAALGGQISTDYTLASADKIENRSMIKIGG